MEHKENIDRLVKETLDSASSIKSVKTPPFLKEKVLNRMAQTNISENDGIRYLNWLTPGYQAAILIILVIINAIALLSRISDNKYVKNIENFVEVYGLSETDTDSYLYQN